ARADLPVGRLDAVVADQVDHPPAALLDHDRQHIAQAAHVAHELELHAFLPVVLAQVLDYAARRRAGIVDHDVDAAERLVALLDEVLGLGVVAQVGRDRYDLAVGFLGDLGRRLLQHILAPGADRDVDAFLGERAGNAFADALAAAGHQRGLAVKLQ